MPGSPVVAAVAGAAAAAARARVMAVAVMVRMVGSPVVWSCATTVAAGGEGRPSGGLVDGDGGYPPDLCTPARS
ncbi:hypothetical protein GCM10010228_44010 [Streptomyces massasporeus]|nr:hypothetical protein GCM10010228_44010 [Streptomyces massasporeus]